MVRSKKCLRDRCIFCCNSSSFFAEAVLNCTNEGYSSTVYARKRSDGKCPECNKKKVMYRSKDVECEKCLKSYHVKSGDIADDEYRNIGEAVYQL